MKIEKEIRDYTRERYSAERKKLASEIREMRREYFRLRREKNLEINRLAKDLDDKVALIENLQSRYEVLASRLADECSSWFRRLLNRGKIAKLNEQIREIKERFGSLESEKQSLERDISEVEEILKDKETLREIGAKLQKFYDDKKIEFDEYKIGQIPVPIDEVVRKYECFIVHAINPFFTPIANTVFSRDLHWKEKLKSFLIFEPSVACSTIRVGEKAKTWAPIGFIVSGGEVTYASSSDAESYIDNSGERVPKRMRPRNIDKFTSVTEQIYWAINDPDPDLSSFEEQYRPYNELGVRNPEIAGFYICLDDLEAQKNTGKEIKENEIKDIISFVSDINMPLYVVSGGKLYEANYDDKENKFLLGREFSPQEIISRKFSLNKQERHLFLQEVIRDYPFRHIPAEFYWFKAAIDGAYAYLQHKFISEPREFSHILKKGDDLVEVYDEDGNKIRIKYDENEQFFYSEIQERSGNNTRIRIYENFNDFYSGGLLYDAYPLVFLKMNKPTSPEELLDEIEGVLVSKIRQAFAGALDTYYNDQKFLASFGRRDRRFFLSMHNAEVKRYKEEIPFYLAYFLYGFSERAERCGDIKICERARKIASEFVDYNIYREVIARRTDPEDFGFKFTEDDVLYACGQESRDDQIARGDY